MTAPSRFTLGWYNGWNPEQRRATLPIQREAIRSGQMIKPSVCSICQSTRDVWLHDERYDRPLDAYAICRCCHRILHMRFTTPDAWRSLIELHGGRNQWFERLSLDPQSQWRRFEETYPTGLEADTPDDRMGSDA